MVTHHAFPRHSQFLPTLPVWSGSPSPHTGVIIPRTCSSLSILIQLLGKAAREQALPLPRPRKYTTARTVKEAVCLLGNHILLNYNHLTPQFFTVPQSHFTTECSILHVSLLMPSVPDCRPSIDAPSLPCIAGKGLKLHFSEAHSPFILG